MQFHVTRSSAASQRTACAVVGVYEKGELSAAADELDRKCGGLIRRVIKRGDFDGRSGSVLPIAELPGAPAERALLAGLGRRADFGRKPYRKAVAAAVEWLAKGGARDAVLFLSQEKVAEVDAYYAARYAVESVHSSLYRIPDLKSGKKPPQPKLSRVGIAVADRGELASARRGLEHGAGIAAGMALTRDLGNLPANVCTPSYLGTRARELARRHRSVRARVMDEAEIRRLRMGAFLSVTRGSEQPPRLIVIEYRGGKPSDAPVALVGKGVTFDSGGISLKPGLSMDEMKYDMGGAASVLGAIEAVATIGAKMNVVGVIPACENMPSGRATKPGDIVTAMSGKTIEVLNTDAEGRLILCDALHYVRKFKPRAVVDIATLTGACVIALGAHYSGLFANDDDLARDLDAAGRRADDRAWHMPVAEEYTEQLKSNFADLANIGGREAGAVTAACFLGRFTEGLKWAHLDIAGTAWLSGARKGSTGRPVPLLVDWLLGQA
ncbi:MAG: leucyl aminopeptidase [Proteobacteria bacterium]|nr:leucyl aminopeptidase [Pseudomonadota bacterium]